MASDQSTAGEGRHQSNITPAALRCRLSTVEKVILGISATIATAIFFLTNPASFGSDSNQHLLYSVAMSQFVVNPTVVHRQAGYPLLLTLTLYPWTFSFLPVLAIQAACAAVIPSLIYKILRFVSGPLALSGALVSIATLLPYNFQTFLFPDHLQVFLSLVFLYFVLRYMFESTTANMAGMFATYLYISFLRPPFLAFFLLIALVVGIRAWREHERSSYFLQLFLIVVFCYFVIRYMTANMADVYAAYPYISFLRPYLPVFFLLIALVVGIGAWREHERSSCFLKVFLSGVFCYLVFRYMFESTDGQHTDVYAAYLYISFLRPPFLALYLLIAFVVGIRAWREHERSSYFLQLFLIVVFCYFVIRYMTANMAGLFPADYSYSSFLRLPFLAFFLLIALVVGIWAWREDERSSRFLQVFLSVVFCYLVVRCIFESTTADMADVYAAYPYISFLRLHFLAFFLLIALSVGIWAWREHERWSYFLKPFLALSILTISVHVAVFTLDTLKEPSRIYGRMVLLNAFINTAGVTGALEDGKYTTILRQKLIEFFRSAPAEIKDMRRLRPEAVDSFAPYQSDPEKMAEAIMNSRDINAWWVLWRFADEYLGKQGDSLFMQVALEQYWRHPRILWNVISTGFAYYLGIRACEAPPALLQGEFTCRFYPSTSPDDPTNYDYPHFGPYAGMRVHVLRFVDPALLQKLTSLFTYYPNAIWPAVYRASLLFGTFFTGVALLFVCYRLFSGRGLHDVREDLVVLFGIVSVYLLYSGPMIILTDPEYRYVSAGALFLVMSGLISLGILSRPLSLARTASRWNMKRATR